MIRHPHRPRPVAPGATGPSTSSRCCSGSASCSSARRSTTRSPTCIVAEILYLEAQDPDKDIQLYINSPGGLAYGGHGDLRRDAARPREVSTICVGMGMSAAAMILCGGRAGQAARAAERQDHDPPGLGRRPRRAAGHGDPPARGAGDHQADGADHRPPLRPPARAGRARHRPRLLHDRARRRWSTDSSTRCSRRGAASRPSCSSWPTRPRPVVI